MSSRIHRHKRIRKKIFGTEIRPRLSVYRSNKNIQVQLINDEKQITILGMSTLSLKKQKMSKSESARVLGKEFGGRILKETGITTIVFDRGGYKYHGRVKALADGLRESGLLF